MVGGEFRENGDPIPEAASWNNLRAYLDAGLVKVVDAPVSEAPTSGAGDHDLSSMTKAQLLDLAEERGVEVPSKIKKADLLELLEG